MAYAAFLVFAAALLIEGDWVNTAGPVTSSAPRTFNAPRRLNVVPPDSSLSSLRVLTWNIDRGEELQRITSELHRQQCDICLLQEVDWGTKRTGGADVAANLAQSLRLNLTYGIEFAELSQDENGRPAYIGQATLTRLPIRTVRVLRFEAQSGFWKPRPWIPSSIPLMQRRSGGRIALVTELEFQGRPLVVYNLHLESRSGGALQKKQLEEVFRDIGRYQSHPPVIVGGDLNSKYFPASYLKIFEQQRFRSVLGPRIQRTHRIAMALDWIFVRGPLRIKDGTVRQDWTGSDHYPVYAQLAAESR